MQNNNSAGEKWYVILNPLSGGKKGNGIWKDLSPLLDEGGIVYEKEVTQYRMHAAELAEKAIKNGEKNILIIGGDGTASETANGVIQSGKASEITIAMISVGTGNDWVRTTGKYSSLAMVPTRLLKKETFMHDAGKITYDKNGEKKDRWFINIAGLGFDGMVAKKVSEKGGMFAGTKIQYWAALLRSLLFYHHVKVTVTVDGNSSSYDTLSIACGICKYNGGGMKQLPDAAYDDGLLDMTLIGEMSKMKMVISLPKLSDGSFTKMKEVKTFRGKNIRIESAQPIFAEADGEYLGETPVAITVVPSALRILKWKAD